MYGHAIFKEYKVLTSGSTSVVLRIAYSLSMIKLLNTPPHNNLREDAVTTIFLHHRRIYDGET